MNPQQLYKLITDLKKIMEKDGKITLEEKEILDSVTKSVEHFTHVYNKALENNVLTDDEQINLTVLWDKIYNDSYEVAMKDNLLAAVHLIFYSCKSMMFVCTS